MTTFSTKRILSSMARRLSLSSRRRLTRSASTVRLSHPISPRPHWPQEPLAAKPRPGFFGHLQLIRELKFARRRSTISRFWLGRASSRGAGLAIRLVRRSRRMKSGSVTVCGAPGAKGRSSSAESASKTRTQVARRLFMRAASRQGDQTRAAVQEQPPSSADRCNPPATLRVATPSKAEKP